MKKIIAISTMALAFAAANVHAQGTVVFQNNSSTTVNCLESAATVLGVANGAAMPSARRAEFKVALYYVAGAPGAAPADSAFVKLAEGTWSSISGGRFSGGNVPVTGVPGGQPAWFQVRVWETAYGAEYADAVAAGATGGRRAIAGQSAAFNLVTGTITATPLTSVGGLTSFTVSVVPEPSTLALGFLGLAGLFLLRRRQ